MDTLDMGLSLDRITVAVDAIEPYVLTWRVGEEEEGEVETTVLAICTGTPSYFWMSLHCNTTSSRNFSLKNIMPRF